MNRTTCSCVLLAAAFLAGCQANNPKSSDKVVSGPAHPDLIQNSEGARADTDRAFQLILQSKYKEAEPILKEAVQFDPMFGPAHNDLGLVYFHLNRLYEAAWEFENAARLMPRQPQPRNNLGLVMERGEQLKEAAAAYKDAWQLAPENSEYIGNLARARIRLGDKSEETQKLLQELLLRDIRPDWLEWAHTHLLRIRGSILEQPNAPMTQPAR